MMEQITLSKQKQFGASSEKSQYNQLCLLNEVEKEADDRIAEHEFEEIKIKGKSVLVRRKKCYQTYQ